MYPSIFPLRDILSLTDIFFTISVTTGIADSVASRGAFLVWQPIKKQEASKRRGIVLFVISAWFVYRNNKFRKKKADPVRISLLIFI
jgi:hypothetical protein